MPMLHFFPVNPIKFVDAYNLKMSEFTFVTMWVRLQNLLFGTEYQNGSCGMPMKGNGSRPTSSATQDTECSSLF